MSAGSGMPDRADARRPFAALVIVGWVDDAGRCSRAARRWRWSSSYEVQSISPSSVNARLTGQRPPKAAVLESSRMSCARSRRARGPDARAADGVALEVVGRIPARALEHRRSTRPRSRSASSARSAQVARGAAAVVKIESLNVCPSSDDAAPRGSAGARPRSRFRP